VRIACLSAGRWPGSVAPWVAVASLGAGSLAISGVIGTDIAQDD
jgi:hypothetical protein